MTYKLNLNINVYFIVVHGESIHYRNATWTPHKFRPIVNLQLYELTGLELFRFKTIIKI
jgi:hypothetical protein